jgi:multiple sugar transport system ATP-binding protein
LKLRQSAQVVAARQFFELYQRELLGRVDRVFLLVARKMSRRAGIEIRGLSKVFRGNTRALDAVDLDVADGELLVLVGPSGSGKTTLLRLIAGLDEPTVGSIRLGENDVAGVPPHRRKVALVFQNLALYSHLTVRGNLEFGPQGDTQVAEVAKLLGISHLLDRYPAELSGGEQQRVALGRAIVRQPAALLLDEPLSSLDAPLRRGLRRELKKLQRDLGMPTIYVTHDQAEALALGDRIAVLDQGRLQQTGTPDEIYNRPVNRFVAEFFGPQGMNVINGELESQNGVAGLIGHNCSIAIAQECWPDALIDGELLIGFRPEDTHLGNGSGWLLGNVVAVESLGSTKYAQIEIANENGRPTQTVTVQLDPNQELPKCGQPLTIRINPNRLHWFDATTGNRLDLNPEPRILNPSARA